VALGRGEGPAPLVAERSLDSLVMPASDGAALPPRPDLSRFMMTTGFVLMPTRFLDACSERCGEYFTLRPPGDRVLVVTSDPQAIKQVFTGDPNLLHAGEGNIPLAPILGERSGLLLDRDEHLRHRRMLLPPFHGERMLGHAGTMREVSERHVARWPRGRRFAVLPSMQAMTLEIIMRVVFGVEDQHRIDAISKPLRSLLDVVASRHRVLLLALTSGRNGPLSPWRRFLAARREADVLLYAEIAARRADPRHGERGDILSLLLDARDEHGQPLSDRELRDELMTLLVAGHETTATALAWTLERVTRELQVLDRLRREPAGEYLDAVIKETLRLRPVVPAVARRLKEPMTFGSWELPAGVHIAPSIYLLHRRADLYPDPLRFDPERFLGDASPGTYEWIPFGGGVRRCLGASFALQEMKLVLESVLRGAPPIPRTASARDESTTRRAITFAPTRGARIAVAGG